MAAVVNGTTPPPAQPPANPDTTLNSSQQPQPSRPTLSDSPTAKRPRDYHLLHTVLASRGVTAYEDRVPLMLMDFAYRYTRSVLEDAQAFSTDAWTSSSGPTGRGGAAAATAASGGAQDGSGVNLTAVRLAIASRIGHTFSEPLPTREMAEMAGEVNRVQLPRPERVFGLRLPPEQFCLTGGGWGVSEEWESEGGEEMDMGADGAGGVVGSGGAEEGQGGEVKDEEVDEDEFEEVMGVGGGEDREMGDA